MKAKKAKKAAKKKRGEEEEEVTPRRVHPLRSVSLKRLAGVVGVILLLSSSTAAHAVSITNRDDQRSQGDDRRGRYQDGPRAQALASAEWHLCQRVHRSSQRRRGRGVPARGRRRRLHRGRSASTTTIPIRRPRRRRHRPPTSRQPKASSRQFSAAPTCPATSGGAACFFCGRVLHCGGEDRPRVRLPARSAVHREVRPEAALEGRAQRGVHVSILASTPEPREARDPVIAMPHGTMPAKCARSGATLMAEPVRAHPAPQPHADRRDLLVLLALPARCRAPRRRRGPCDASRCHAEACQRIDDRAPPAPHVGAHVAPACARHRA